MTASPSGSERAAGRAAGHVTTLAGKDRLSRSPVWGWTPGAGGEGRWAVGRPPQTEGMHLCGSGGGLPYQAPLLGPSPTSRWGCFSFFWGEDSTFIFIKKKIIKCPLGLGSPGLNEAGADSTGAYL